ncbi:MAG: DNA polymerase III subunit alpha [Desulfobacteraceae bacterium]
MIEDSWDGGAFVHLHVHSHYSRGWGIPGVEELCRGAREKGMDTLALTDTNGLYGLIPFMEAVGEAGISPVIGSELVSGRHRAVCLVRDETGYADLCRLISRIHCDPGFELPPALRERRRGLVVLSDDAPLLKALRRDGAEDLFVEISPGYGMSRALALSRETGIPPVATNRVCLLSKKDFPLHRILRAVALNTKLSRLTPADTVHEGGFLCSPGEMIQQFPHAPHAVRNTLEVASRCRTRWSFDRVVFPRFERISDQEAYERLRRAAVEGCRKRYGRITPEVRERLEHEMRIIRDKGFSHYFLVVADITRRGLRSCGRGSAAASIVAYALGITHVDPIRHDLFFERFLNPDRADPPDIDVDFAWDERHRVLDYVFSRYGHGRAAMVANHNTYGPRSALREVAKVFGLTDEEITRASRARSASIPGGRPWDLIREAAVRLNRHLNHLSVHCGGVVIVPDEIRRYCPVEVSAGGLQVLQWEKDAVEESGLVKIDLLGNRSLAVIRDCLSMVERNHGRRIDYAAWDPVDDPETAAVFYRAQTMGVFYFESPATRQVLAKAAHGLSLEDYLRMDHFQMNVVVTSIIRPASNRSIREWVSRLHGAPWEPPHPLLRPVLAETLGVMVFQEQLSRAAVAVAGFSPAEADTLRKVVSKKDREKKLRHFHARFLEGARLRGVDPRAARETWDMMMGFDGYSFCKPHSASYTMVAYKSAWLRAHYPAEFMASVISNGGGYYFTFGYLSEARRMGLEVLPPDVNLSGIAYTGKGRTVRVGLMQVRDLRLEAREALVHERSRSGPFNSFGSFLDRMRPHLQFQDVRTLIRAGCLDSLAGRGGRPGLLFRALGFFQTENDPVQGRLFADRGAKDVIGPKPLSKEDLAAMEHEALGLHLSIHPLELYERTLEKIRPLSAEELPSRIGSWVTLAGWPVTSKTVKTQEGDPMIFMSFEDRTALYEAVFFPREYRRFRSILEYGRAYLIKGRVEEDFGAVTVNVGWIGDLARAGD